MVDSPRSEDKLKPEGLLAMVQAHGSESEGSAGGQDMSLLNVDYIWSKKILPVTWCLDCEHDDRDDELLLRPSIWRNCHPWPRTELAGSGSKLQFPANHKLPKSHSLQYGSHESDTGYVLL